MFPCREDNGVFLSFFGGMTSTFAIQVKIIEWIPIIGFLINCISGLISPSLCGFVGLCVRSVRRMGWCIPFASTALNRFSRCYLCLGQHKIICCWSACAWHSRRRVDLSGVFCVDGVRLCPKDLLW